MLKPNVGPFRKPNLQVLQLYLHFKHFKVHYFHTRLQKPFVYFTLFSMHSPGNQTSFFWQP